MTSQNIWHTPVRFLVIIIAYCRHKIIYPHPFSFLRCLLSFEKAILKKLILLGDFFLTEIIIFIILKDRTEVNVLIFRIFFCQIYFFAQEDLFDGQP